jgi:hypothetical protein
VWLRWCATVAGAMIAQRNDLCSDPCRTFSIVATRQTGDDCMFDDLGMTPDAVASALRTRGVRGVRNTARFLNPIVRYAHTKVSDATSIDLMGGDRLRIVFANNEVRELAVPEPVLRFLDGFHRGEYPDLELPTEPG